MCINAVVGKRRVTSQGELAEALGLTLAELVREPQFEGVNAAAAAECCLCPVHGPHTARRAGWRFEQEKYGDGWCGEMHFTVPVLN